MCFFKRIFSIQKTKKVEEEEEEEKEEKDLLYVPGYLNRLIDPLLKSRVPLSISETARHQSGMCYQTGKSIKRDGKTERGRGDRGTGSKLSADWFSHREVGFRGLAPLATDLQESGVQHRAMEYPDSAM